MYALKKYDNFSLYKYFDFSLQHELVEFAPFLLDTFPVVWL